MKPRASSSKTPNNALFGIDESLFTLPKDDEAQVTHVDVKKLLSSVHDDIENVGEDDVDENDPVLLRELEAVQRGEDHIIEEAPRQNAQLEDLRTELEHEREAMMLFEREGEDTSDMLETIRGLQQKIASLEGRPVVVQPQQQEPSNNTVATVRFQELKAAASAWNAAGDKGKARMYLQQAKDMQSGALTILPPKPAMPGDSLKAVAAKPVVKAAAAAAAPEVEQVVPSKPAESKELRELKAALDRLCSTRSLRRATDAKKWDSLLNGLREEARRCNALALELKETEKKLAVDCFRRQKECLRLIEQAIELKNSGSECPSWQASLVFPIRRIVINSSVSEDIMAVSVLRGGDVASSDGKPISSFVKIVYSYHPTSEDATDAVFSSACLSPNSRSPEWNFIQLLPIQRKKTFQKWLERKDLKIELWESKGWLRGGDVLIGRVDIPVEPLLKRCTIRGVFPVVNNRKRVGPQLEVCVMLRTPLLGPEEDVREERWIEVGQWPEPGASAQELHDEAEQRRLEQAIEAQKKIDQSNPFDTPFDRELAIAHPEAPERLKSLFVLDFMANSLRQSPVDPTGETMRLLARVQARAQLLTVAMRSVPEYVRCLQQCVAEETALAQHFKSANNKDAAIACLRRVKLMRSEIDAQQTTAPAPSPPPSAPKSEPSTKLPPVKVATAPPVQVAPSASVDHDSVDSIVSVAVIDFELGLVGSDEDGQLRKSELEIKRQMIIMAIEMGSLTAEEYAANLNKRIAADKQLAKMFNDRGDKAKALKMLKRAKLMENELAS